MSPFTTKCLHFISYWSGCLCACACVCVCVFQSRSLFYVNGPLLRGLTLL